MATGTRRPGSPSTRLDEAPTFSRTWCRRFSSDTLAVRGRIRLGVRAQRGVSPRAQSEDGRIVIVDTIGGGSPRLGFGGRVRGARADRRAHERQAGTDVKSEIKARADQESTRETFSHRGIHLVIGNTSPASSAIRTARVPRVERDGLRAGAPSRSCSSSIRPAIGGCLTSCKPW